LAFGELEENDSVVDLQGFLHYRRSTTPQKGRGYSRVHTQIHGVTRCIWFFLDFPHTQRCNGLEVKEQPKTSRSRRSVNISPATTEVLKQHKKKCCRSGKKMWKEPRRAIHVFHRIVKRADAPKIRFHDLRHTHATLLLQQGVDPKIVSECLGHASITLTLDTYSHVIPSLKKEATMTFDQWEILYQTKGLQCVCNWG